jgi:CheY-like chemotaxis protein/two-component sensor histidine kinase
MSARVAAEHAIEHDDISRLERIGGTVADLEAHAFVKSLGPRFGRRRCDADGGEVDARNEANAAPGERARQLPGSAADLQNTLALDARCHKSVHEGLVPGTPPLKSLRSAATGFVIETLCNRALVHHGIMRSVALPGHAGVAHLLPMGLVPGSHPPYRSGIDGNRGGSSCMSSHRSESGLRAIDRWEEAVTPDDFVSMVSHELRGGFAVISGLSATLAAQGPSLTKEEVEEIHLRLRRQSERMGKLIEDLLDVHQLQAGRFSVVLDEVDISSAISQALGSIATPGHPVDVRASAALKVVADELRLVQVLANLLDNALKYGAPPVSVEASLTDDGVLVSVTDRGGGVPEEFVPHLFKRFRRGAHEGSRGSGLGLAISLALAQAMHASIWYESAEPRGARFNLLLVAGESSSGGTDEDLTGSYERSVRRSDVILVVDDEPDMRFLLRIFLGPMNKEIVEATNGAAGLEKVRELMPGLIITDLMMPVMDGQELIRRVRAESDTAKIPVLLLSANPDGTVGADAVLRKPFGQVELLQQVRVLMGET